MSFINDSTQQGICQLVECETGARSADITSTYENLVTLMEKYYPDESLRDDYMVLILVDDIENNDVPGYFSRWPLLKLSNFMNRDFMQRGYQHFIDQQDKKAKNHG